ncbi:MAG: hypothetical protein DMG96_29945 [Acidobacteria bacterium]|nr:MAG: hypothetical protein DMG96_29945 [Acidobacteriota bacterium]
MELIDRYLQAVKFWLPSEQKQDIVAELSADIHSQIDERESALGRKLSDDDVEQILKQRGRPLLVAEKYLPQKSLIGPVLFPAYRFVLKLALLCYLVPWAGVWIALVVLNPSYRANHLGIAAIRDAYILWFNTITESERPELAVQQMESAPVASRPRCAQCLAFRLGGRIGIWDLLRRVVAETSLDDDRVRHRRRQNRSVIRVA